MTTTRGLPGSALALLCASFALLSGCAAGSQTAAPSTDAPFALRAGERLDAVAGTHPIDRAAAQRFRQMRLEHRPGRQSASPATPRRIHAFWAIWPRTDTGVEAEQVIWPNLTIGNIGTVLYAPTMYPATDACIESTTSYEGAPYGLQIWAWNWCAKHADGNVGKAVDVDAEFIRTYTRAAGAARAYRVRVEETNAAKNEWTDYLYNYASRRWNVFFVSSGAPDGSIAGERNGWDAYETYSGVNAKTLLSNMCGDVAAVGPIVSEGLSLKTATGWALANASNSFVAPDGKFYCPLEFRVPKANYKYSVSRR